MPAYLADPRPTPWKGLIRNGIAPVIATSSLRGPGNDRCCQEWNLLCRAFETWPVCGPAEATTVFPGVSVGSKHFPLCGPAPAWSSGEYECAQEIDAQGVANALGRNVMIRVGTVVKTYSPGAGPYATGAPREEALIPALARAAEAQREERNRKIVFYGIIGIGVAAVGAALYYGTKG